VRELATKLVDRFRELGIKREATAAVAALRQACEQEIATVEMVEEVAAYLRELDRRPDVALPPPRWV